MAITVSALLPVATMTAFWTGFFGLFRVTSLLVIIDKAVGGKLDPHSGPGRLLRVALHRSYPIRLYRGFLVTNLVLFSNISKRTMYPVFYTVLIGLFAFFVVNDLLLPAGVLRFGGYEYLPERADQRSVEDRYYRDQREEDEVFAVTPSIQSDVVSGPYLKLFVPYYPQRHNDLFAARCRGVRPLTSGGMRFSLSRDSVPDATVQALFDCWSRIQPVTLNGEPIRPEWFLYTQPESGIRGKLAYVPTAAMAKGMNLLTVGRLPRRRSPEEARPPYVIRFWR